MTPMTNTVPSITTITLRWLLGLRWVGMAMPDHRVEELIAGALLALRFRNNCMR